MRLLPILGLSLLALPFVELAATLWLIHLIGWWVLPLYAVGALIGIGILRSWRFSVAWALLDSLRQGEVPLGRLFWVARSLLAGILFIIPGPVTDVIGLILILPWPGHNRTLGTRTDEGVIDGEFTRVVDPAPPLPRQDDHRIG